MDAFVTAHGSNGSPDDLYVNCDHCGAYGMLGLGFAAEDSIIEDAVRAWSARHQCREVSEYGLREFPNDEKAARYFGLPDDYR
jgi:hypothetical protein